MFRICILLAFLALSLVPAFATRGAQTSFTNAAGDLSKNIASSEKSNLATISDWNIGLPQREMLCPTCESLPKKTKKPEPKKPTKTTKPKTTAKKDDRYKGQPPPNPSPKDR